MKVRKENQNHECPCISLLQIATHKRTLSTKKASVKATAAKGTNAGNAVLKRNVIIRVFMSIAIRECTLKQDGANTLFIWIWEIVVLLACRYRKTHFATSSDARNGSCIVKALMNMVLERATPMARYQLRSTSMVLPVKKPFGKLIGGRRDELEMNM